MVMAESASVLVNISVCLEKENKKKKRDKVLLRFMSHLQYLRVGYYIAQFLVSISESQHRQESLFTNKRQSTIRFIQYSWLGPLPKWRF